MNGLCSANPNWQGKTIVSIDCSGIYNVNRTLTDAPSQISSGPGDSVLFLHWDENTSHVLYFSHGTAKVFYGHVVYGTIAWKEISFVS